MGTQTCITDKRQRQQERILKRNIKQVSDETEKARQLQLKNSLRRPTSKYLQKKED